VDKRRPLDSKRPLFLRKLSLIKYFINILCTFGIFGDMSRQKGNISEDIACDLLKSWGHSIVERNYISRYGEIDVITEKDKKIHIVEVKSSYGSFDSSENFSFKKIKRILKTAQVWSLYNSVEESRIQIDLIVISHHNRTYRYIKDANLYFH